MRVRKAEMKDLSSIMKIINEAKIYFKENNVNQWQDGYPNEIVILNDIEKGESFVVTYNGEIVGTSAISLGGEKTYNKIYKGKWINKDKYIVIHRLAISNDFKGKGIAKKIFDYTESLIGDDYKSIRIDTHEMNYPMQRTLEKLEFKYCGEVLLESNEKRIAFERTIQ